VLFAHHVKVQGNNVKVIFISMDTLRADRLSCLGNERGLTPNLDRIAGEGALFTQCYASDIPTQPSHTAIFTGRYGVNTGIVSHFHPSAQLDQQIPWLPSIFQASGRPTGAVDHLFAMKDWFVRGYDDYMPPPGRSRSPGSVINEIAFPWLDKRRNDDFFLFLHFWDSHIPYVPPPHYKEKYTESSAHWTDPLMEQRLRSRPTYPLFARNLYDFLDVKPNLDYIADLYDAEVAYLDHQIGRLFVHLEDLGILDETLVVLFGDHGENMTEHDAWFDHAGLYDSVVHVPLILWAPGQIAPVRVSSQVALIDVQPTVLELMDMPAVPGVDGQSLVPLMRGETSTHRDTIFLSECTWQAKRGVRTKDWKFIQCIDPGVYPRGEEELYDLHADPDEQVNVAQQHPDVASRMGGVLALWLAEQLGGRPDPMQQVVADGLPAVVRLDSIISPAATGESLAPPLGNLPAAAATAVVPHNLPTSSLIVAGADAVQPYAGASLSKKKSRRRRVAFVAIAAILAALAIIFAVTSLFSGPVQAAGVLQPTDSDQLNFSNTAPINSLWVVPGQHVHKGEILATQDTSAIQSQYDADESKLTAAQVALADGPTPAQTPQQLASQVDQAQAALSSAQTRESSTAALDGVAVTNARQTITAAQDTLGADQESETSACSTGPQGSTAACDAAQHEVAVDQAALTAANGAYQDALQTQNTDIQNGQAAVSEAQAALATAQANQAAGTQPQTATDVSSEQAAVTSDEATVAADKLALAQAYILAPYSGTIATVNGSTGDLAGPDGVKQQTSPTGVQSPTSGIEIFPQAPASSSNSQPQDDSFITMQSRGMRVEAQISETDVGQIHMNQRATVTFPADPGSTYDARVSDIEPAAVNQGGKVYFLVYLRLLTTSGHRVISPAKLGSLSGLSADITFN
jgi:arylsulfatase